ncbi:MAG: hypothetical protein KKB30_05290 [Proteobacteria bacterium]|nr:hypothetical protein [Pseudomonadota bacterium]MBU1716115.1 hypothetical protein [Pseudomonadota bacterium]
MDLVDLITEKRFLGQEFMTWLWYKSEERGGTIELPESGDIMLVFEKHMLLESGEGESHEKIICQGLQAELKEARTGLAMGKKIEQARIVMGLGEYEWRFSLRASMLDFRNMKLPKTMDSADEGDGPEAMEGRLLDKIGLYEMAVRTVDNLFRMFVKIRTSGQWPAELQKIRGWINQAKLA